MKISFILPTYNMEKYLARCIDSVINQDMAKHDYEIIIVNDGSTDNSLKIVEKYACKNNNIIIYSKKNAGLGAARNTGLEIAKGKYIFFLDTDDYIVDNCISNLIEIADNNKLDILTFISTMTKRNDLNKSKTNIEIKNIKHPLLGIDYVANYNHRNEVWWYIINREFLKKSSINFDEGQWLEDAIFTAKLFLKANKMAHVEIDVHRYRIRQDSIVRNKNIEHYKKILSDQEKVIFDFDKLINKLPQIAKENSNYLRRIKNRQQSFVFFFIIRFMKSGLSYKLLKQKLNAFKEISAYPLKDFVGEEYNGFKYNVLTNLFNSAFLLKFVLVFYKLFNKFINK
ncbi:glycosyltransferase family 2 protein [Thalassobellus sediminis]|uniref:glycosyltransferase family 2 protein n=1 Tax=Thalassobellus sediminis TaxID=3367753 RepID=UPI0037B0D38F